jgi:hypothetical protein
VNASTGFCIYLAEGYWCMKEGFTALGERHKQIKGVRVCVVWGWEILPHRSVWAVDNVGVIIYSS